MKPGTKAKNMPLPLLHATVEASCCIASKYYGNDPPLHRPTN